jgi:transposase
VINAVGVCAETSKTDQITRMLLEEDVRERPAATVSDRRLFLETMTGKSLSISTVKRLLKRLGFSQKNGQWARWSETSSSERPGEEPWLETLPPIG